MKDHNQQDNEMLNKQSPYPENDIKTLMWDVALLIGEDPEKFIQNFKKPQNKKFDAKQHWRDTFGTEPPEDFGYLPITEPNTRKAK